MTKDQIASTITRLSEESAAAEMHRTVSELESVISDLRTSAARLKRIPGQPTIPVGYVDTQTAAALLDISRQMIEKLGDTGKLQRIVINWRIYYSITSIKKHLRLQMQSSKVATSPKSTIKGKMTPEQ